MYVETRISNEPELKKDDWNDLNLMNDLSDLMNHCFEAIHLN